MRRLLGPLVVLAAFALGAGLSFVVEWLAPSSAGPRETELYDAAQDAATACPDVDADRVHVHCSDPEHCYVYEPYPAGHPALLHSCSAWPYADADAYLVGSATQPVTVTVIGPRPAELDKGLLRALQVWRKR